MPANRHLRNILELNLAILFISTSGALGKYVSMPTFLTVGYRGLFACILLFIFCRWQNINLHVERRDRFNVLMSGIFMGIHWLTYFYALQLSNVAVGMLSLFTFPVITALLEPIVLKTKFEKAHILSGILVLIGIYFLVPEFDLEHSYTRAIGFGILSAFSYSIRNLILKPKVAIYNGTSLMFYQMVVITICLAPFFFAFDHAHFSRDLPALLALALLTTAIGHTLFLFSLKHFTATTASIIGSMQPIYGIIIGIIFLQDFPEGTTLVGGVLILGAVILESIRTRK